jgi:hypothetical protein
MEKISRKQPLLRLKFEGEAIRNNTILFDDLATFVSNISTAIDRLVQKLLQKDSSIKRGRPLKALQILSALEIVSVRRGSFRVGLDLRRNGEQFPGWDLGEQAIDMLMVGLKAMQRDGYLPEEYDTTVMIPLRDAGRVIERGVSKVSLNSMSALGMKRAVYTLPIRERIISHLQKWERAYTTVEGRLTMLDVEEGRLVCRIRPSAGEPILCRYNEDLAELVMKNIRQFVQVKGEATYDPATDRIVSIQVRDLEAIDRLSEIGVSRFPISPFWKGQSFDELATAQGVYPIEDIGKLSGDWPEDTDFDAFLDAVRSARV